MTVHLVYPHAEGVHAAPWSIGNHLAAGLREAGYDVAQYGWEDPITISPRPGDVLIGHPHPQPGFVFTNSVRALKWSWRVAITPYGGLDVTHDMIDGVLDSVDALLLICGPYWAERVPGRWRDKATTLDMAVDPARFPPAKGAFSPPASRAILYIGCSGDAKGTPYLERLIAQCPDMRFGHVGAGHVRGAHPHGMVDFRHRGTVASLCRLYDFVICPGKNDANPTTALEAACWGLIPLCVPTAGWDCFPLLSPEPDEAASQLHRWQCASGDYLIRTARMTRDMVVSRYTWTNFINRALVGAGLKEAGDGCCQNSEG